MKIATSLNIKPTYLTDNELMLRIAAAEFDGIDFNFCDLIGRLDWDDERLTDSYVDNLGNGAASAGLTWVQAHGPMFNMFSDTEKDSKNRALCANSLRACGRLGVPWMVLHPETLVGPFDSAHYKLLLQRNVDFFRGLLPLCERYNVGIAIENMPESMGCHGASRFFGGVPSELVEMIDTLDHPLIGACWDTGHAKLNRIDQRSGIAALGTRLKVLHIQENDGRGDDHMLPFVNGPQGIDWAEVVSGLHDAGYVGAFTYETHNSFRALPEPLFDDMLRLSVNIARFLSSTFSAE